MLAAAAHEHGALVIVAADPLTLGVIEAPGNQGADVCVGEGQSLGNRLDFGGPSFGFFAATEKHMRTHARPDRGRDDRRRRAPRLRADAADARAAHPPREGDVEHLHVAGAQRARRRRLPQLARAPRDRRARRAHAPAHALRARDAVGDRRRRPSSTTGRSCASSRCASTRRSTGVIERCAEAGVNAGYALGRSYDEYPDGLLVAITEQRSRADIDRFADGARQRRRRRARARRVRGGRHERVLDGGATPQQRERATTIFEKGAPGRRAFVAPALDVPEVDPLLLDPRAPAPRRAAAAARGLRAGDRAPLRQPLASATSTSTRASIRSARAR